MDDLSPHPALLPAGLRDLLPPDAQTEADTVETLMAVFASHGYARVKPPMLEYEDNLLSGSGAALADQSFRLMDPDSHRMMALRADMTPQVARIAATRLAASPRPLRLSYAGECIRTRGLRETDRQVPQAGIEVFGSDSAEADAETMLVAAEALAAVGLSRVSLDLALPTLTPALLDGAGLPPAQRHALGHALDRKDAAGVLAHGGALAPMLSELLLAAGPAAGALAALERAALPESARPIAARVAQVAALLARRAPSLRITIDPLEFRGLKYHTGIAVTVFAPGRHEELGRGGRYLSQNGEPATGITLYADAVLRAAPPPAGRRRVFVPLDADPRQAAALRAEGYVSVAALAACDDVAAEAERLGCSHALLPAGVTDLEAARP
jgi:ATP phosphoribosyltransferase regulatory subunit